MRQVGTALAQALAAEVGALALTWRIVRRDGAALGFTTHDRTLWLDGLEYRPAPGMSPSAIQQSDGFEVSTMEIAGALSSEAIGEADLAAGLYDGALVTLALVDWETPDAGSLPLARGAIGQVSCEGLAYTAELRGPTRLLDAPAVELLSSECRATLGDARCRVDLSAWTWAGTVAGVAGAEVAVSGLDEADGLFAYGRLRSLASGRDAEIVASTGDSLTLREPAEAAVGDRIELRAGCDKRFATCCARFGNALNFRGEPHVPGGDAVGQYPGV